MKILSALQKGLQSAVEHVSKSESVIKGEAFENYVREFIFPKEHFEMVERTHAYEANRKDFVKSSLNPDFKFFDKKRKKEFWLEAKFRSETYRGKLEWCSDQQLKRYLECHKSTSTFVIIAVGGKPTLPESLYLLSLSQAKYTGLFETLLKRFEIPFDKAITSELLWNR
jgi:hypothetical protein